MPVHPTQEFGLRRDRPRGEAPIQKANRLLLEDRVRRVTCDAVYDVDGDSGTYRVLVGVDRGISCPCQARTPLCAHVLAVAQALTVDVELGTVTA